MLTKQKSHQKRILISRWVRWLLCGHLLASFLNHSCLSAVETKQSGPWRLFMGSAKWTLITTPECPTCQQQRPTKSIQFAAPGSHLVEGWLQKITSTMEGTELCSQWNRHFGYRFAFPIHKASTKTTPFRFTDCVIHTVLQGALLLIRLLCERKGSEGDF